MALLHQIKVPLLSVNDTTLTVVEISFDNGSKVVQGDIIMVFETSKTTYDVAAESGGYIEYRCVAGNDYEVNDVVANIYSEAIDIVIHKPVLNGSTQNNLITTSVKPSLWQGEPLFSNEANILIGKNGFDRSVFSNRDFVSRHDVEEQFKLRPKEEHVVKQKTVVPKAKVPVVAGNVTIQKLSSNKKREIQFLSAVQSAGLTSTLNTTIDTFGIFAQLNKTQKYLKNSLLPIILYEGGRLLKKYPLLNAFFDDDNIALYDNVNMGFAIDAGKGLKVLKIENTNTKSIGEIEEAIMNLSGLYLDDKLSIESLSDITFTVTDLSSEDVSFFQPLINMQNSAILGVSAVDEKLNRCTLSLTFDHRVMEGKLVAVFLKELKERLSTYQQLNSDENLKAIKCFKCYKTLAEDFSEVGFAKCITNNGKEAYICQSCFKGF